VFCTALYLLVRDLWDWGDTMTTILGNMGSYQQIKQIKAETIETLPKLFQNRVFTG
jgi:hypothetical protein